MEIKSEYYLPSNGTEGSIFMSIFCDKCYKSNNCTILLKSLIGKQPKQWIYDESNKPFCSSFNAKRPKSKTNISINNQLSLI